MLRGRRAHSAGRCGHEGGGGCGFAEVHGGLGTRGRAMRGLPGGVHTSVDALGGFATLCTLTPAPQPILQKQKPRY